MKTNKRARQALCMIAACIFAAGYWVALWYKHPWQALILLVAWAVSLYYAYND